MIEKLLGICIANQYEPIPSFHRLSQNTYIFLNEFTKSHRAAFLWVLCTFSEEHRAAVTPFVLDPKQWLNQIPILRHKEKALLWEEAWEFQLKMDAFTLKRLPSQFAGTGGLLLWGKGRLTEQAQHTPSSSFTTSQWPESLGGVF